MDPATRLYSCDDHLDLPAVPPGLWQSRLPRAQAECGPHVVRRDGKSVWVCEDRAMGISGTFLKSDALKKLSAIGRAGIEDDGFNPRDRAEAAGRARAGRVGLRRRARLYRHPHPLRRAGFLGSGPQAVIMSRRHHRGGGTRDTTGEKLERVAVWKAGESIPRTETGFALVSPRS